MKKFNLLFIAFIIVFTYGCKNISQRDKDFQKISEMESKLFPDSNLSIDRKLVTDILIEYTNFVKHYPTDSVAANYLFKAGELAMNMNLGSQAITYFNKIQNKYPEFNKYPYCIFLQAFVYDSQLNNLEKAKEYYEFFIKKYPEHELVNDAKASIENLGKSPEEIIRSFEEKAKQDSL
ncbi:MAG: tetratricopeptide repeat protein [Bacteroidales bacterium]|nr:tetratricopeptide repeat protein [Bacteroidales bacterium]